MKYLQSKFDMALSLSPPFWLCISRKKERNGERKKKQKKERERELLSFAGQRSEVNSPGPTHSLGHLSCWPIRFPLWQTCLAVESLRRVSQPMGFPVLVSECRWGGGERPTHYHPTSSSVFPKTTWLISLKPEHSHTTGNIHVDVGWEWVPLGLDACLACQRRKMLMEWDESPGKALSNLDPYEDKKENHL